MLATTKSITIYDAILLTHYHNRLRYTRRVRDEQSRSNQSSIIGGGSTISSRKEAPMARVDNTQGV